MDVIIITPAGSSSRSGNATTAGRWARILRGLGHKVRVATKYDLRPVDLMIALHAWRSAEAVHAFRQHWPGRPLIVALSGTDVYDYVDRDPARTLPALESADRLIGLQELVGRRLPARFRKKLRVIHQSAPAIRRKRKVRRRHFDVAVIAHLRDVKDPLRAAQAARLLSPGSRLRIVQVGAAESLTWAEAARSEMAANPRYIWKGDVPRARVRALLGCVQAMVLSSHSEGGANVLSEAIAAGVPVLASRIDGSIGLLGRGYPGFFPVGDTVALARLLDRIETEPGFLASLERAVKRRRSLFRPEREKAAWKRLLRELADA